MWLSALRRTGRAMLAWPAPLAAVSPFLWMGLIWYLSAQPFPGGGHNVGILAFFGNLAHAPLFGTLALLWSALFLRRDETGGWPRLRPAVAVAVASLVVAYGLADEWHQSTVGTRHASLSDVFVDGVAAACVLWVVGHLGSQQASEAGVRRRLAWGVFVCAAAAAFGVLVP